MNEQKKKKRGIVFRMRDTALSLITSKKKVSKGAWRMPWLSEAMKDVISCDKLRVSANNF